MDIIFLSGLTTECIIGIWDWERRVKQKVVVDLEMAADIRAAAASDPIEDTLDYKTVSKRLLQFIGESEFQLVETLTERIAQVVIAEFDVPWVRVRLNKQGALRGSRDVGILIERTREDYAAWRSSRDAVPCASAGAAPCRGLRRGRQQRRPGRATCARRSTCCDAHFPGAASFRVPSAMPRSVSKATISSTSSSAFETDEPAARGASSACTRRKPPAAAHALAPRWAPRIDGPRHAAVWRPGPGRARPQAAATGPGAAAPTCSGRWPNSRPTLRHPTLASRMRELWRALRSRRASDARRSISTRQPRRRMTAMSRVRGCDRRRPR